MNEDHETLAVYDKEAAEYEARVAEKSPVGLSEFLGKLPNNAHVLDLGCGPGLTAVRFQDVGHKVDAVDGSASMVERAIANGVSARQALFSDISGTDLYDGIWANFSLLHLPHYEFEPTLARLHNALKPNGVFHIGMKIGSGESRDRLGRFYSYYQPEQLNAALKRCGFTALRSTLGAGRGLEGSISEYMVVLSHG
ncbi:class I SAM-dependent DNA methyltransferase [Aliiroseovarius sp. 2305UL8-7]|uniref:class I SAM-dependent DNA methyltransferase n=1 Tax=Aliiroseovarius conchicola TaxID=3121637 RepID=UPI0035275A6C